MKNMTLKISKARKDKWPGIGLLEWIRNFRKNSIKEIEIKKTESNKIF